MIEKPRFKLHRQGVCPVDPRTKVQVILANCELNRLNRINASWDAAGCWQWDCAGDASRIIAYRVAE